VNQDLRTAKTSDIVIYKPGNKESQDRLSSEGRARSEASALTSIATGCRIKSGMTKMVFLVAA
jgi:hypothetical protein